MDTVSGTVVGGTVAGGTVGAAVVGGTVAGGMVFIVGSVAGSCGPVQPQSSTASKNIAKIRFTGSSAFFALSVGLYHEREKNARKACFSNCRVYNEITKTKEKNYELLDF